MMDFWEEILDFTEKTTASIGMELLDNFGTVTAQQKTDGSLVTQCDQWADQELHSAIQSAFPEHGILSEEGSQVFPANPWCWVLDPLDATTNFTRGIPIWGISMGLLYQGTPVFGYVYLPPLDLSFHGFWQGESDLEMPTGAYLNYQEMHPSVDDPSGNHFFNLCSRSISAAPQLQFMKIRMLGMATYNFLTVACGATLGGVEATPKIWDIAAAWVMVKASGAVWLPLQMEPLFPLKVGEDYGKRSYPTLVLSRRELVPVFQPLVNQFGR